MTDCKPTSTSPPLAHLLYRKRAEASTKERQEMATVLHHKFLGALVYLSTKTRPDISAAVSMLEQLQSDPTLRDWKALKYVLQYLKETLKFGLQYSFKRNENERMAWSEAD